MRQPPVALLMDFDGVILDSMEIKTRAFVRVYAGEPASKLSEVLAYQRLHGGVTRRTKFAYFEKSIFGRPGDSETVEQLASAYRDIIYDAVVATAFVPGAEEFLRRAPGHIALHLISGTPQDGSRRSSRAVV
jgi:beta-phosphoglucomutase-like phosphatase (HAD superfamily)